MSNKDRDRMIFLYAISWSYDFRIARSVAVRQDDQQGAEAGKILATDIKAADGFHRRFKS